jgi:hypothetical protein
MQPFTAAVAKDELKQLLGALGADFDEPGDRLRVRLSGRMASFRYDGAKLPPEEVVLLKRFLQSCGVAPAGAR